MPWSSAVFEEEKVAVPLGDGVGGKAGGRDDGGEAGGLIVEEALDGAEVLADLGAAGAGAGANRDEGVKEGEGAGHVPRRAERLDEADLDQRGVELGFADLPGDALGQPHQGTALPLLLPPTGRPVLRQAPPQIARLADVE